MGACGLQVIFDREDPESIAVAINRVPAEIWYDTMRKSAMGASEILNWETEAQKLPEIYRRLSYRFDNRTP